MTEADRTVHLLRDDRTGTLCGAPETSPPLGSVVIRCPACAQAAQDPKDSALLHYMGPQGALHATLDVTDFPGTMDWREVTCPVCLAQSPMETYALPQRFIVGVPGQVLPEFPESAYPEGAVPLEPTQAQYDDLTEAEELGLLVGAAYGTALAERDKARAIAVALEQDLAEAERLLRLSAEALNATTWAADSVVAERVTDFLNRSGE